MLKWMSWGTWVCTLVSAIYSWLSKSWHLLNMLCSGQFFFGKGYSKLERKGNGQEEKNRIIFRCESYLSCPSSLHLVWLLCGFGIGVSICLHCHRRIEKVECHIQLFSSGQVGDNEMLIDWRGRVSLILHRSLSIHWGVEPEPAVTDIYTGSGYSLPLRHTCSRESEVC